MKPPEYYSGREQTYLKHFILERYLERVAYNILSFADDFVYVDGFSGPWKSKDDSYEDTSFMIAVNKLGTVRDSYARRGRNVRVRCMFIEKDTDAFAELQNAISTITDIEVKVLRGSFENLVADIRTYIGRSFSLVFIDPTGWTGFGLEKISPLLRLRGEVLINFMFDYINRFLDDPRPEIAATFDPLFGGPSWNSEVEALVVEGMSREAAVLLVYQSRARRSGGIRHMTSTRVLKPLADRAYFYLVYGTNNWKGLHEFRQVEKKAVDIQERVRSTAKHKHRLERTGQDDLFGGSMSPGVPRSFDEERAAQLKNAQSTLRALLNNQRSVQYENVLGAVLEMPLVWPSDVNRMVRTMHGSREIEIMGLRPRERTPKPGHTIVWKGEAPTNLQK